MSYCKEEGVARKDKIIFITRDDNQTPSAVSLDEEDDEPGLILDNGEINWSCPCLGGMATGPCGLEFREAFSCFHYSQEDVKGTDCYDEFKQMQECMSKYPELYDNDKTNEEARVMDNDQSNGTDVETKDNCDAKIETDS